MKLEALVKMRTKKKICEICNDNTDVMEVNMCYRCRKLNGF